MHTLRGFCLILFLMLVPVSGVQAQYTIKLHLVLPFIQDTRPHYISATLSDTTANSLICSIDGLGQQLNNLRPGHALVAVFKRPGKSDLGGVQLRGKSIIVPPPCESCGIWVPFNQFGENIYIQNDLPFMINPEASASWLTSGQVIPFLSGSHAPLSEASDFWMLEIIRNAEPSNYDAQVFSGGYVIMDNQVAGIFPHHPVFTLPLSPFHSTLNHLLSNQMAAEGLRRFFPESGTSVQIHSPAGSHPCLLTSDPLGRFQSGYSDHSTFQHIHNVQVYVDQIGDLSETCRQSMRTMARLVNLRQGNVEKAGSEPSYDSEAIRQEQSRFDQSEPESMGDSSLLTGISRLPGIVLIKIFSFLNRLKDLDACSGACLRWSRLIEHLKPTIERDIFWNRPPDNMRQYLHNLLASRFFVINMSSEINRSHQQRLRQSMAATVHNNAVESQIITSSLLASCPYEQEEAKECKLTISPDGLDIAVFYSTRPDGYKVSVFSCDHQHRFSRTLDKTYNTYHNVCFLPDGETLLIYYKGLEIFKLRKNPEHSGYTWDLQSSVSMDDSLSKITGCFHDFYVYPGTSLSLITEVRRNSPEGSVVFEVSTLEEGERVLKHCYSMTVTQLVMPGSHRFSDDGKLQAFTLLRFGSLSGQGISGRGMLFLFNIHTGEILQKNFPYDMVSGPFSSDNQLLVIRSATALTIYSTKDLTAKKSIEISNILPFCTNFLPFSHYLVYFKGQQQWITSPDPCVSGRVLINNPKTYAMSWDGTLMVTLTPDFNVDYPYHPRGMPYAMIFALNRECVLCRKGRVKLETWCESVVLAPDNSFFVVSGSQDLYFYSLLPLTCTAGKWVDLKTDITHR
ncbi:MAG: hypothetical protein ACR2PT_21250 [Endozoicomonas sp.]